MIMPLLLPITCCSAHKLLFMAPYSFSSFDDPVMYTKSRTPSHCILYLFATHNLTYFYTFSCTDYNSKYGQNYCAHDAGPVTQLS